MALEIPLTPSQQSLERFLAHMAHAGKPPKVNGPYLKSVGFRSGNDSYLVGILKQLDFLDASAVPTARWQEYRNATAAPAVMAAGILHAYPNLFHIYPDAQRKDDEAIRNWIRGQTDFDSSKVQQAVATFRTLCKHADFDVAASSGVHPSNVGSSDVDSSPVEPPADRGPKRPPAPQLPVVQIPASPTVTINIQLQLPASADGEVYDKFFQSMRKHLFPNDTSTN